LWTEKHIRKAVIIGVVALTFQQCTGIDSLAYFSTLFYTSAGLSTIAAQVRRVAFDWGNFNIISLRRE
jgi:hypothetical protein